MRFLERVVKEKIMYWRRTVAELLRGLAVPHLHGYYELLSQSFLERSHNSLRVLEKPVVNFGWNLFDRHISLRIGSDEIEKIATKIE